jgi:hypothetical protein
MKGNALIFTAPYPQIQRKRHNSKSITKETIEKFKQNIINTQCGNPRIKKVMSAGMKTLYFYNDKNGNYITDFVTGISDCR